MKNRVLIGLVIPIMFFVALPGLASNVVRVEVLYMNHGPMQPVVRQLKDMFSRYGTKINVSWYDLDTGEGQKVKAAKGLMEHMPLMVWIDGRHALKLTRGQVKFAGFPAGSGPEQVQGKWTMKDLESALDQATAQK